MKYKIYKGTNLYDAMVNLWEKRQECIKEADNLGKQIGATHIYTNGRNAAGGIDAFRFEQGKEPPKELWMQQDRHNNRQLFYPRYGKKYKGNNELHEKIKALPVLTFDEVNYVIDFKTQFKPTNSGIFHIKSYGYKIGDEFVLIEISEYADYVSKPDMIEITVTEFKELEKTIPDNI